MKTKKIVTVGMFIGSVLLCSCNETTNPVDQHNTVENTGGMNGTWVMIQMTIEVAAATYTVMASDSQQFTLTLNSDLTYHQKQISISSGVNVNIEEDGTYSVSGSSLNQVSSAGTQTNGNFSLTDNTMVLTSTKISQGQMYTTVYQFRRG